MSRVIPWRVECERCDDTGWVLGLICDGGFEDWPETLEPTRYRAQVRTTDHPRVAMCARRTPHQPHTYVEPCVCRGANRTYTRHHQQESHVH